MIVFLINNFSNFAIYYWKNTKTTPGLLKFQEIIFLILKILKEEITIAISFQNLQVLGVGLPGKIGGKIYMIKI